ncbi:MAG: cytochrome c biogenesis protein CcsA [Acidobacteria bacterium]|nr:cytochrome c biogenesis protein CcsA [Acidobacteriota bacterium]
MIRAWFAKLLILALALTGLQAQGPRPDAKAFGALPVLHNGRVKPLDTVGRSTLLMIRGKQTVRHEGQTLTANTWMLDLMFNPELADKYQVFMINDADVVAMLGKRPDEQRFFSLKDLEPKLSEIMEQSEKAHQVENAVRDRFQRAISSLGEKITAYQRLKNSLQVEDTTDLRMELSAFGTALSEGSKAFQAQQAGQKFDQGAMDRVMPFIQRYQFIAGAASFAFLPPAKGGSDHDWVNVGNSLLESAKTGAPHPSVLPLAEASHAWKQGDKAAFDKATAALQGILKERLPAQTFSKASLEVTFNALEPFYKSTLLYLVAFLMYCFSWIMYEKPLQKAAWWVMLGTLALHTFGMVTRMYLEGRPPVTNLYSSAVFIGWFAVLLAVPFERYSKRGFAALGGCVVGAATLVIAQSLTGSGDTMGVMVAVLDSNFWLATHVTTITIGYSATFLAGLLAHIYILRGLLSSSFTKEEAGVLVKSAYGVICFALFFSFVGTVLGGIWADQSWGRFWGWDPKENGALLIVLWNALILHARWAGMIRDRGLMIMAIVGGIITSLSWFGVNMLGIGLHSYGFMDQAFYALVGFAALELLMIGLACLPPHIWRSKIIPLSKN